MSMTGDPKGTRRGLKDISHLFLSNQGIPRDRTGAVRIEEPVGSRFPPSPEVPRLSDPGLSEGSRLVAPGTRSVVFTSSGALAQQRVALVCELAFELACRDVDVCLVGAGTDAPNALSVMESFHPEWTGKGPVTPSNGDVPTDAELFRRVTQSKRLQVTVGAGRSLPVQLLGRTLENRDATARQDRSHPETRALIVDTPCDISELIRTIRLTRPIFLVPTTVASDEVLNAYLQIREISRKIACSEIGLLVVGAEHHRADGAFRVVAGMARSFLSRTVRYMGYVRTLPGRVNGETILAGSGRGPMAPVSPAVAGSVAALAEGMANDWRRAWSSPRAVE